MLMAMKEHQPTVFRILSLVPIQREPLIYSGLLSSWGADSEDFASD